MLSYFINIVLLIFVSLKFWKPLIKNVSFFRIIRLHGKDLSFFLVGILFHLICFLYLLSIISSEQEVYAMMRTSSMFMGGKVHTFSSINSSISSIKSKVTYDTNLYGDNYINFKQRLLNSQHHTSLMRTRFAEVFNVDISNNSMLLRDYSKEKFSRSNMFFSTLVQSATFGLVDMDIIKKQTFYLDSSIITEPLELIIEKLKNDFCGSLFYGLKTHGYLIFVDEIKKLIYLFVGTHSKEISKCIENPYCLGSRKPFLVMSNCDFKNSTRGVIRGQSLMEAIVIDKKSHGSFYEILCGYAIEKNLVVNTVNGSKFDFEKLQVHLVSKDILVYSKEEGGWVTVVAKTLECLPKTVGNVVSGSYIEELA